jgi:hypothetical protein
MFRRVFTAFLLAVLAALPCVARPAIDIAELRRLDGAGTRAWAAFRQPDSRCGILRDGTDGTRIYNTFEGAILSLDFNGQSRRILPLLLTDKPGEDHILKHKVRTACVLSASKSGPDYLLELTTRIDPPGTIATLRVDAEGRVLNLAGNEGLFYVVGENSRANRQIDRFEFVRTRLSRFTCMISETREECEYQFLNYAERVFSDEIRHQAFWPDALRRDHHTSLNEEIAARISDPLLLTLHKLIIANESATISPFQLWDAVLADSGLSFGPHQWDIGINADAQRIFTSLALMPSLQPRLPEPERFFKSVRRFSTGDLRDMLLLAPEVNAAMQSPAARDLILREYVAWLETDAMARARKSLPTLDPANPLHQVMLLYYIDVDNQYGAEDIKAGLRSEMERLASTSAGIAAIRTAFDARMMATPFAIAWPDKAAARLERTWTILKGLNQPRP